MIPAAAPVVLSAAARALAPRQPLTVSQWADAERYVSGKGSPRPGKFRTADNPPLREIMDCLSERHPARDIYALLPIQFGKSDAIAINAVGYYMTHSPASVMVVLPTEKTQRDWIAQKLNPSIEATPVMRAAVSQAGRDSANQRDFKDLNTGGQLYIEHAGSTGRLKLKSIRVAIVDEFDELAQQMQGGDDPEAMIDGRTSAFQTTAKRLKVGTPMLEGTSRLKAGWNRSDQRRYNVPCPHCGHEQPLVWAGLHWTPDAKHCWYVCRECGCVIEEHHKPEMIRRGRWVPENPESKVRGYQINCLYYPFGMGPRWLDLVQMWLAAQADPGKLKTFINERLAETFEDPAMRAVKLNLIADRVEPRPLRPVPSWVLAVTAGVDTQDNRLAVQIVGWGRGLSCWPIDYVELNGDPANDDVWVALTDLLLRPIDREAGGTLRVEAAAIDTGGHRGEAVKAYVRQRLVRRLLPIFGSVRNTAPPLGKGKLVEVNWRGQYDKRGVHLHEVGTVGIKHLLYSRLSTDADKPVEQRMVRLSHDLDERFLGGLVSETYDPAKNRFVPRRGAPRNEPLDTWVYAYAATHHPELRLHRYTKADWDGREAGLSVHATVDGRPAAAEVRTAAEPATPESDDADTGFASRAWGSRL